MDESVMREYLLGQLHGMPELVDSIDEEGITDPDFSQRLDVLEDEILEDYIHGALSEQDKVSVETHFLVPPQRRRKLHSLRLLLQHLTAHTDDIQAPRSHDKVAMQPGFLSSARMSWSLKTSAIIAAILVFAVPAVYLLWSKHPAQTASNADHPQTAVQRNEHAPAPKDLHASPSPAPYEVASLNLLQPGLTRGDVVLPRLKIADATKTVHIQIAVLSATRRVYSIQLRAANGVLATQEVQPQIVPGGSLLTFDLPASDFPAGECHFLVTPHQGETLSYALLVSKSQQ